MRLCSLVEALMQMVKNDTVRTIETQKRTATMTLCYKVSKGLALKKCTEEVKKLVLVVPVYNNICVHFNGNNRVSIDGETAVWCSGVNVQLFLVAGPSGEPVVGAW